MAPLLEGVSMNLFGIPYQFTKYVDHRFPEVSNTIGQRFAENIVLEAPVLTILPGKPNYLPGKDNDFTYTATTAFLDAAVGEQDSYVRQLINQHDLDNMKLYDFKLAYGEYMDYVNALCRAGAVFLRLNPEEMDSSGLSGTGSSSFQQFDWKNYHWTTRQHGDNGTSHAMDMARGSTNISDDESGFKISKLFTNYNYVQFYIDPDLGPIDSFGNMTQESMLNGMFFQQPQQLSRELSFLTGGSSDALTEGAGAAMDEISATAADIVGNDIATKISHVINLGGEAVKGNNIVMPEIYQSSSRSKSYSITVHLKTPYGNVYGYYLDIFVPLMHLMALVWPKAASANSYSEPFIIKGTVGSIVSFNLGIVEDATVTKVTDTLTADGYPTEVDVTLTIKDLYLDMSMSKLTDGTAFVNNSSLVEYLGMTCGMDLLKPNFAEKEELFMNLGAAKFTQAVPTVVGHVRDAIYNRSTEALNTFTRAISSIGL